MVVLGVTSLQGNVVGLEPPVIPTKDDPQKEYRLMGEYISKKNLTWPVVFSRHGVFNPNFGIGGIPHVAILDTKGVVRHSGLGSELMARKDELIDELLREAGRPVPPAK